MKKALTVIAIIGGTIAVKKVTEISFKAGMGFLAGMMLASENEEKITAKDVADDLAENGFSLGRLAYYTGVHVGQNNLALAENMMETM